MIGSNPSQKHPCVPPPDQEDDGRVDNGGPVAFALLVVLAFLATFWFFLGFAIGKLTS